MAAVELRCRRCATYTRKSSEEGLEQESAAQATCMGTKDFAEAMRAWIQKRDGEYTGE